MATVLGSIANRIEVTNGAKDAGSGGNKAELPMMDVDCRRTPPVACAPYGPSRYREERRVESIEPARTNITIPGELYSDFDEHFEAIIT